MEFKYKILIVDDVKSNVQLLKVIINTHFNNIEILEAYSAEDALKIFEQEKVDLLLTDIDMPGLNGYELSERLSANIETKYIPIVFISGVFISEVWAKKGLDLGAYDYIIKPIDTFELVKRVKIYIKLIEKQKYLELTVAELNASKKEMKEQYELLVQQSKMAAMGEMIANITHQWRQPLNALGLLIQKAAMLYDNKKLNKEAIDKMSVKGMNLINKMSDTITCFQDFLKLEAKKENFSLNGTIEKSLVLVETSIVEASIKVVLDLDNTIILCSYENIFLQVLVNLINNVRDAFVGQTYSDDRYIFIKSIKEKNGDVTISIKDNAGGIAASIIDQVFDSYFTTKTKDKGTGLGLSMSKKIINDSMHGEITCENEIYKYDGLECIGAEFKIELPAEDVVTQI